MLRNPTWRAALLLCGLSITSVMPPGTMAQDAPIAEASPADPYADHVAEASRRFGIPVAWIGAVMRAESDGDPRAQSSAGAMGLMQIMPATWAGLRARYGFGRNPYDPRDNILAGTAYLAELHRRYGTPGFLAAYHAGPGRYEESLGGRPLPARTRAYLALLAPVVDGSAAPHRSAVTDVDTPVWTRAPLFILRSGRVPASGVVPADPPVGGGAVAPLMRDVSASEPQSTGLFVAGPTAGEPR